MRKAFLIIDMQKGSFTDETPRYDSPLIIERINHIAASFRANSLPVIFIQHDGTGSGEFVPQTKEWELLDGLERDAGDIFIDKYANDVFYRSALAKKLDSLSVSELVIAGCATDFCVEATVQSALAKDFNITVAADAHTTADRPHLKAVQVIEHYNWVWKNMLSTKGSIRVVPSFAVLKELDLKSAMAGRQ
ncbi:cysteine hydrolase family protein [Dyadobacter pollutisoli]|uniref:Cysteine hydrolase family protein n=1 Tax=Dyadobacter pollutisoli TaxID=2910158 RepID=A0A9E8NBD9_9BACT|nr:cysteine hydrolase family protein [Dyadobacter pollutisoli]WAC13534.1 cysteine hydrolase family protein [Dyadobacter pollutisoli]